MKMKLFRLAFTISFVFLIATQAISQVTTAGIGGLVTGTDGESLPGATVIAVHEPSGTQYGATTNAEGRYIITGMRPGGPYRVNISFVGYSASSTTGLTLRLGDTYVLNTRLVESNISIEDVIVTAARTVEKSGTTTNISSRQLETMPTISRSINDFTRVSPYAGRGNSFAGRDGRYNNITIDGAAFNNNFGLSSRNLPGGDAQPISLDAIDEISVNVSPYDIRQSNFTGASINAITKSGDNQLKVSAYTYLRPKSFTGDMVGDNEVPGARERFQNTYGISIGAPIIQNKLFIFVNGELEKEESPGIEWRPSKTDGSDANAEQKISRTTTGDLSTIKNFLINNYDYNPGDYENFGNFASKNHKFMARIDWNINDDHKFTFRFNDVKSQNDVPVNANSAPNPRGAARIGLTSMAFSNANYNFTNYVRSYTAELNSRLSPVITNKLLASYTHIQDTRGSNSDLFPFVDIYKDGAQYMSFGYELFTFNNDVTNNTFNVTNNVTFNLGKHVVTGGVSFDHLYFLNSYLRYALGYYRYASMQDFMNNAPPTAYGLTYGYGGNDAPGAELTFGMGAVYAQDEFSVNENFKITAGVRVERPFYFDELSGNDGIANLTFADGQKVDVSKWPEPKVVVLPRAGFNWDIQGDGSLIMRGGTGIFSGLLPFVWYTNQPTNSGVIQNTVEITNAATLANFSFEKNWRDQVQQHQQLFPSTPSGNAPGTINIVSPEFQLPKIWRSTLGFDIQLPADMTFTAEAMYSSDLNAIVQQNINEKAPAGKFSGSDTRQTWRTNIPTGDTFLPFANNSTANTRINTSVSNAMVLSNASEGYQYSLMAQLTKRFTGGLSGLFSYTYSEAKDLTSNPGSAANSAWSSNTAVNSLNSPGLSYSGFNVPHRVVGSISYRAEYIRHLASTFTLFYTGSNMGRMSFTYSNDLNGDGVSSDLMYIPNDKNDIQFNDMVTSGNVVATADAQRDAFWSFVENDSYLNSRRGQYAERFGKISPWLNRFDFKFAQELFTDLGTTRRGTLHLTLDVLNAGNLIDSSWGTFKTFGITNGYDNIQLLRVSGFRNGQPVYQLNAANVDAFKNNAKYIDNVSTSSTWAMLLGIKLTF
jgi:hypothetical protein